MRSIVAFSFLLFLNHDLQKTVRHKKLRESKTCLNCGQQVEERFCTHCGQENLELQDSVWKLVGHYLQDMFSYDNRIWHTLKYLLLKPGHVAREYMDGKRKQNLEPIRFYIFASSVFFLLLFLDFGSTSLNITNTLDKNYSKRLFHLKQEKEYLKGTADTAIVNQLLQSLKEQMEYRDTPGGDTVNQGVEINLFDEPSIDTMEVEGWLSSVLLERFAARLSELENKPEGDEVEAFYAILDELLHTVPQLFFLSLPFFAFFLKLLYFRRPKNSYVEHFIFTIYHYAYTFIIMILFMFALWLSGRSNIEFLESVISYLTVALAIYPFYYLFVSMKRFYNDRWGRLILRYLILLFMLLITLILLFIGLAIFTFLW